MVGHAEDQCRVSAYVVPGQIAVNEACPTPRTEEERDDKRDQEDCNDQRRVYAKHPSSNKLQDIAARQQAAGHEESTGDEEDIDCDRTGRNVEQFPQGFTARAPAG